MGGSIHAFLWLASTLSERRGFESVCVDRVALGKRSIAMNSVAAMVMAATLLEEIVSACAVSPDTQERWKQAAPGSRQLHVYISDDMMATTYTPPQIQYGNAGTCVLTRDCATNRP